MLQSCTQGWTVHRPRRSVLRVAQMTLIGLLMMTMAGAPAAHAQDVPAQAVPEWIEPRGLSVPDLVGLVPESHLRGAILAFTGGGGIIQYLEGRREGDLVTIRVSVSGRYENDGRTRFNCLGQRAYSDHWSVAVPASQMRVYSGGQEVTDQIIGLSYFPSGLIQPVGGAGGTRYAETSMRPTFTADGALQVPANMGCKITLRNRYSDLIAVFQMTIPRQINVEVLGSETFTFRSYSGPGDPGRIGALQSQLQGFLGNRHDKFRLNIPSGADFLLVNYPPSPVSNYSGEDMDLETNIRLPSSGTYRLANGEATLSVDHDVTMGLPLYAQWQDADQAGDRYLRRLTQVNTLTSLEYFVPVGVEYDPCMRSGGCPQSLLQQIANANMQLTVYYYRVTRISPNLVQVPLRQVGNDWKPGNAAAVIEPDTTASVSSVTQDYAYRHYLPLLPRAQVVQLPPDNTEDCPCGAFTADGRLLDLIPEG